MPGQVNPAKFKKMWLDLQQMHEMFVGHQLKGGVVPGRGELLLPCETRVPTAPLTAQVECLHSIARLGLVDRFDRPRASGMLTAAGLSVR